jgi:hypothetical protein
MESKTCKRCGGDKPLSMFHVNRSQKDERHYICKPCNIEVVAAYNKANPEKHASHSRYARYRKDGIEMSPERFETMLEEQRFSCAICFDPLNISKGKYGLDHNHKTGEARGILCPTCNKGIGLLKDNPVVLRSAATYLDQRGYYG